MNSLVRLKQMYRLACQLITKNKVAIIGGYHGVNLGDMALGLSVKEILNSRGIKSGLQTIYTLDKYPWPKTEYAIIGGGAIGYKDSLIRVANRFETSLNKLALLGVDYNDSNYEQSNEIMNLLQNSVWLSCRNENQASTMRDLTHRQDIVYHPDLVFSYKKEYCKQQRAIKQNKKKILLINVVPLYGDFKDNLLRPNPQYKTERPELYSNYEAMVKNYVEGVRGLIQDALSNGYEVESIPFTPGDATMAKFIAKGLDIKHNNYSDDPFKVLKKMSLAEKVFATRYHATIFGIKLGAQVMPMAYAKKNEILFKEFGFSREKFISASDLANGGTLSRDYLNFEDDIVVKWENSCNDLIHNCIDDLLLKDNKD
jgi:polysaccharide pyruvyl transferase WcaK-like protein